MAEINEGLTMEQDSPDLNDGDVTEVNEGTEVTDSAETEESAEFSDSKGTETRKNTKKVSDRINAVRAEKDARIRELESQLENSQQQLLRYRANEEGITEEELAARDRAEAESFREALHNDPEFRALQERDFERQKQEVISTLQKNFPNDGIESLETLPQDFFRMLQAGVSPVIAYRASVADEQKPTPPSSGSVKSKGETVKGNLTEEQALSMSTNDWIKWLNERERRKE